MDNTNSSRQESLEVIKGMRLHEEQGYCLYSCGGGARIQEGGNKSLSDQTFLSNDVRDMRRKLVDLAYEVVEFCEADREVVVIAFSFLDRFLATDAGMEVCQDMNRLKLAAMTSVYTAIKMHNPPSIPPSFIANMSDGLFTEKEVEEMELKIAFAIQWRLNPPTVFSFLRHYLFLLPSSLLTKTMKETSYTLAVEQIEMALRENHYVTTEASTLALASLLNVLRILCVDIDDFVLVSSTLAEATPFAKSGRVASHQKLLRSIMKYSGMEDSIESVQSISAIAEITGKRLYMIRHASNVHLSDPDCEFL